MDFAFTDEQQSRIQSTEQFAGLKLQHTVGFSRERWKQAAMQGLTALPVSETLGGSGCSVLDTVLVFEALGRKSNDSGFVFSLGAHLFAGVIPVMLGGNEAQQNYWLPRMASGSCLVANAMTETSGGSDAFSMRTTAVKNGTDYQINGTKQFCTNAPEADVFVVYALTDPAKGFFGGVSAFLVERGLPGVSVGPVQEKMGLENSPLAEVFFDNVTVPETHLIGKPGGGAMLFQTSMNWERIGLSAWHVGSMQQLLERSIGYAQTRTSGEKPIRIHQAVSFRLADMQTRCEAARMLVYRAAAASDEKKNVTRDAAMAKIYASEALIKTAQDALLIHGGNGYMKSYNIERFMRDALASAIYSGTNDVLRNLLAAQL